MQKNCPLVKITNEFCSLLTLKTEHTHSPWPRCSPQYHQSRQCFFPQKKKKNSLNITVTAFSGYIFKTDSNLFVSINTTPLLDVYKMQYLSVRIIIYLYRFITSFLTGNLHHGNRCVILNPTSPFILKQRIGIFLFTFFLLFFFFTVYLYKKTLFYLLLLFVHNIVYRVYIVALAWSYVTSDSLIQIFANSGVWTWVASNGIWALLQASCH